MLDISCQSHLLNFESKWSAISRINIHFFVFERIKCNLAKKCWLVVVEEVEVVVVIVVEVERLCLGCADYPYIWLSMSPVIASLDMKLAQNGSSKE